jgi:hypothetical protein
MIIIHNISKVYSKTGWQKYEVKINDELICKFNHRAADGLAKCLAKASSAVYNKRSREMTPENLERHIV